jgi:hypothetical protein
VAGGYYTKEAADVPISENGNICDLQSTSQWKNGTYIDAAWDKVLRLLDVTRGRWCITTINHNI